MDNWIMPYKKEEFNFSDKELFENGITIDFVLHLYYQRSFYIRDRVNRENKLLKYKKIRNNFKNIVSSFKKKNIRETIKKIREKKTVIYTHLMSINSIGIFGRMPFYFHKNKIANELTKDLYKSKRKAEMAWFYIKTYLKECLFSTKMPIYESSLLCEESIDEIDEIDNPLYDSLEDSNDNTEIVSEEQSSGDDFEAWLEQVINV